MEVFMSYNDNDKSKNEQEKNSSEPLELFMSYSHKDEALREALEKHLMLMQREGIIKVWNSRKIMPGQNWENEIDSHLETADIIIFLVTPDFIASDYCCEIEMKRAMERHALNECFVIPIIMRDVDWHSAPFAKLQSLPIGGKPVTSWPNIDEALSNVAKGIRNAIKGLPLKKDAIKSKERLTESSKKLEHLSAKALKQRVAMIQMQHISKLIDQFSKVITTIDPLCSPEKYAEIKLKIEIYLSELEELEQKFNEL
ncbi:Toll-Interleukin receptor domain protein [Candidatus Magnetobacterium bavaricum]|uniref:Toll-Interleukin receptor domain protein n=1 Tax=Candidatus Magnetobacterium bavaricum TaxID=29290 RepID=A0A0F3GVA5_9BACT|nr:Toll-Interleukin receptor domain protein [Candidatus Magnetobacterium bavaricum]